MEIDFVDETVFMKFQRSFCKINKCQFLSKDKLLFAYKCLIKKRHIKVRGDISKILQMKNVRSQSGIAVVSVLTKPFPCPGNCLYCPSEKGIPKSYLSGEPAVMRAQINKFHPYKQVISRLRALKDTGHIIDKISIRIIGGTWSYYPRGYKNWFIRQLYMAANEMSGEASKNKSLEALQIINETAKSRIVELSVETRPDYINYDELIQFRKFGITKVELGVQSLDDKVLNMNRRGHTVADTARATKLLKDYGFKVSYQMMLNLYGSNYQIDLQTFKTLFADQKYRPDHLKIYPLAVIKNSEMAKLSASGLHSIYGKDDLIKLIADIKLTIPAYCRIERVIRDIPANKIVSGGAKISNLRQFVEIEIEARGKKCQCVRCREIKGKKISGDIAIKIYSYQASGGREIFIRAEAKETNELIGFCRLRLNLNSSNVVLNNAAVVREIHVYGPTVKIAEHNKDAFQHQGWGKAMMLEAEKLANRNGCSKIAVIAGVGVRGYFKKLGYILDHSYMIKMI